MVVMCRTREEAERALVALRAILSELGLTLKDAKTRIVELREGGEGLDFLGFHHRWVRGNTSRSRHLCFLARWPSHQAMARARGRIRHITDRRRLRDPVEDVVQELNSYLRAWAGYFRYGNSAQFFDKISLYTVNRLSILIANRYSRDRQFAIVARQSPNGLGLIDLNGIVIPPRPDRPRHRER
jgi:RNA-directed DNA polymerase